MKKYRVMVVKYGYTEVEAETEEDAVEQVNVYDDQYFDWSDFDDAQVVDELDEEE